MMNRFLYLFLLLGCAASALVGCTDDPNVDPLSDGAAGKGASWVTIDFDDNSFDQIRITTRATLDNVAESRVANLFVFIFDPNGDRLYGRYFDYTNRKETLSQLQNAPEECWWVADNSSAEEQTNGTVRLLAPKVPAGSTLYLLANVNADMVNISPDKLRFVETLDDLRNMTATLNQQITERNGFFPMTGHAEGIAISGDKITAQGNAAGEYKIPVMLTRLDAKVEVKLRVAAGYSAKNEQTGTTHTIESFEPLSWQVVNLPRTAFVLPHDADARDEKGKKDFFNTRELKFETRETGDVTYTKEGETKPTTESTDIHGFSFYMLENRPDLTGKTKISALTENPNLKLNPNDNRSDATWRYHLRDTRQKHEDGTYDTSKGLWEYAPEEGTYLVIKGEIVMKLDLENEGKDQQLSADAIYYIHLGDFAESVDNYDIERNTHYTYTITIYGVDNIQIEVETKKQEKESGATGHVYVAKERIFTFDSHFASEVVSFDEAHLTDIDHMTWYVRTPFGREGRPRIINGVEVPSGLDYRWVKFSRNSILNDGTYSKAQEKYHPDEVMDILQFSKFIKEQKQKFEEDKADGVINNDSYFRREFDEDWYKKFGAPAGKKREDDGEWYRYRIYLTIFVDEFYYDANPLTGDVRDDLWKDFVNQPHRLMHILCDSEKSADEASLATGSVVTIRQRSIQTVFNTEKPELKTAWGCETIDETRDVLWYFSRTESYGETVINENGDKKDGNYIQPDGVPDQEAYNTGKTTDDNGLYNTARIWGLLNGSTYTTKLWGDFIDYDRPPSLLKDADDKETLRYACMARNRDEDGDGIIDAKEVKWYLASISQLTSLYIGDQGLSSDAVLYPYYKQKITSPYIDTEKHYFPWRSHIVSSTIDGAAWPEILWAEEGMSTGAYNQAWGKAAPLSIRCVRNLGMDPVTEEEAQKRLADENNTPEKAIQETYLGGANSVYRIDLTNLNPLSIRYYTSQELEPRDEHSVEARTYWVFETGPMSEESHSYSNISKLIRDGRSPCPEGYRVPNVREGALMSMYCPNLGGTSRVSTFYSHGLNGTNQDLGSNKNEISVSWHFNKDMTYLDGGDHAGSIRCVKDIRQ